MAVGCDMKVEHLLSPEFVEFSQKVAEIYKQKEDKVKEFKELYMRHKADVAELEASVSRLKEEFESKVGHD